MTKIEAEPIRINRISRTNLAEMIKTLPFVPVNIDLDFQAYGISKYKDLDDYLNQCKEKKVIPFSCLQVSGSHLDNGRPYILVSNSKFEIPRNYNASESQRAGVLSCTIKGGMVHRIEAKIDTGLVCEKFLGKAFPELLQEGYNIDSGEMTFYVNSGKTTMFIRQKDSMYKVKFEENDIFPTRYDNRVPDSNGSKLLGWFKFWKDKLSGQGFLLNNLFDD